MSFLKRAAAIVLCLCMAAFCCACDEGDEESAPVENVSAVTKDEYVKAVKDCLEKGKRCEKQFLDETAAYFYGFALSSAGSMRFAAEKILWLKGEGNDFSEVTSATPARSRIISKACCAISRARPPAPPNCIPTLR